MWLYPPDEKGNSLMAHPTRSQEDFTALRTGIVRQFPDLKNAKTKRKEFREKLDKEVFVTDEILKAYINNIIRKDLRFSSFNILIEAKKDAQALMAYFNFINAYQLYEKGEDSYGNICCMAIDRAKKLLKIRRVKRKK